MAEQGKFFKSLKDFKEFLSGKDDIAVFRDKPSDLNLSSSDERIATYSAPTDRNRSPELKGKPIKIGFNVISEDKEYKGTNFSNMPTVDNREKDGSLKGSASLLSSPSGLVDGVSFLDALVAEFEVLLDREAEGKISDKEQKLLGAYRTFLLERTGMNEGGAVMDKQMEMAFAEGGTLDLDSVPDNTQGVDPVSGNEVPLGSMPQEVRDDIPAQLSEGEYVVPADVVRFFGVKFFEDLRTEAKTGFNAMEANGRIGGEPIGMEMGGDELPFDISELQIVDDGEEEQPMMNKGGYISGYAPGGLVDTGDIPLTEENYQGTGMEQRQYSNAAGNIITILFFNGMPMSAVPDGYSPYTPEAVPSEAKEAVVNDNDDDPTPMENPEPTDYKALSAAELRDLVEDQKSTSSNAIALGVGMLNPLLGMAFKAATWHQSKQITKELQRRMEDPSLDNKQKAFYTDLTETMTADQPGFFERLFGKTEEAKKPEVTPTVMAPEEVEAAVAYTPEAGYVPTGMPPVEAPSPITVTSLDDEPGARDYKGPLAPTVSSDTDNGSDDSGPSDIFADAASKADEGTAKVVKAAQENLATESEISDIQKEGVKIKEKLESSAKGGGYGFSEGGLASKPKKKKK